MRFRRRHGPAVSLVLASHPLPALVFTAALTAAAALSGRPSRECALVAVTVLVGRLTVGWMDDLVDRNRDRQVGRQDRPVAMGWVDPGTVAFALAVATLAVVPLSVANGLATANGRARRDAVWSRYGGRLDALCESTGAHAHAVL